jgi:hypothetical protein
VRRSLAIGIAATLFAPGAAGADTVMLGRGVAPMVAANQAGEAVAAWQRPRAAHGQLIAAVRSRRGKWSPGRTIGTTGASHQQWWFQSPMDVAIDGRGNAVVVWTRRLSGRRERVAIVAVTYRSRGGWSDPHVLARVRTPDDGLSTAPGGVRPRPRVALDAAGSGVATWARVLSADPDGLRPSDPRYVVEAATLGAGGVWTAPQTLGHTDSRPSLDVTAAGDALVAWQTGTLSRHGDWLSIELVVAEKPTGGTWSPPRVIMSHQADPGHGSPAAMYHVAAVLEPQSGRATASWTEANELNTGYTLEAATRAPGGPWPLPVTVEPTMSYLSPVSLVADERGEVNAVWQTRPDPDRIDEELRAATCDANGRWSAPTTIARTSAGPPFRHMSFLHAATSPSGQLFVLVRREDEHPTQGRQRSTLLAFTRTADHVWSKRQIVARSRWSAGRVSVTGDLATTNRGRALVIWSASTDRAHSVRITAVAQ